MTIYVRTEAGQQAAYGKDSELSRKLKSLLKVIDGKTSDDVYVQSLHAFGDVLRVLQSLEIAGLIAPVSNETSGMGALAKKPALVAAPNTISNTAFNRTGAQAAIPFSNTSPSPAYSTNPLLASSIESDGPPPSSISWSHTLPPLSQSHMRTLPNKLMESSDLLATMSTIIANSPTTLAEREQALIKAKQAMLNFALEHNQANATTMQQDIAAITSLEDLAAGLGGYAQVIAETGMFGQAHLKELKQLLQDYL